jgi:hypothetical protein
MPYSARPGKSASTVGSDNTKPKPGCSSNQSGKKNKRGGKERARDDELDDDERCIWRDQDNEQCDQPRTVREYCQYHAILERFPEPDGESAKDRKKRIASMSRV